MKRLRRIIFNIPFVFSLLLCVATAALWARGYWKAYWLAGYSSHWTGPINVHRSGVQIYSEHGHLLLLSGIYDETISTTSTKILREVHLGHPEGRSFYVGPTQMTPIIDPRQRAKAQIDFHGIYLHARWGPYSTPFAIGTTFSGKGKALEIGIPGWLLILLTAILPALRLGTWLRRRARVAKHLCPVCSYDLRATPDRCPECGAPASFGSNIQSAPVNQGAE
jgi:hypothetical protein